MAAPTTTRPRRWIRDRLAELDPETDWLEIWQLSSLYGKNDFQFHWFYAVTFPYFLITERGAETVYRDGAGKLDRQSTKRVDDTVDHMVVWWEHGPDAPQTRQSVHMINQMHAHWARTYPGNFSFEEDYVNTLCYEAASMHRVMRSLGLPGYSEKQQRASHRFWSRMAPLFLLEDGSPVTGFPEDFAGCVAFLEEYENRPWPVSEAGTRAAASIVEHFATRWFPAPLRPFGRALVTSFYGEAILRVHRVPRPSRPLRAAARTLMRTLMWLGENVLPDGDESFPQRRRRLAAEGAVTPSAVETAIDRVVAPRPGGGCPHAAG